MVAQSVERWTENPYVGGSIPPQGTTSARDELRKRSPAANALLKRPRLLFKNFALQYFRIQISPLWGYAGVAQLAEQLICNQQVTGSIPATGSIGLQLYIWADSRAAKWIRL